MPRYEKYEPIAGGFRATLEADLTGIDANGEWGPRAVSLNTAGRVVVGTAGASGLVGVLVKNAPKQPTGRFSTTLQGAPNPRAWLGQKAGDRVDIMTNGEIVDVQALGLTPGVAVYAAADGTLSGTATGNTRVGWMVENWRMVVRLGA